ncbi:TonB-dependent receptor [Sphingobacterium alkalisoli]|uniref:TonB-dependent receptor n=1 Tax=Sphingobacterium alkalisoli TaxID=1874115 RepID=A0A4U0H8I5_9SPHI|nr:TonB-dependent receptor [Sphingobacterium alkalisoli]TJY68056.1 TonB-dependent receptor [Sphingobacterium alkalisoli]
MNTVKLNIRRLILVPLLFCAVMASAQQNISGNIIDKTTSLPLEGVTIRILNTKDSSIVAATTNKSGIFTFTKVKKGNYLVETNFIGFKTEKRTATVDAQPQHLLFRLEPSEIEIEEVEITVPQAVMLKGDTMEYDARNYATREFADADELVSQIPGVQMDEEGNVTAHGEQVTKIIVDGKEFFSSDPRIALKTLPAEIIAKIQIIDEKSEQARFSGFDDGSRNKVINIVTKPDRRHGHFGKTNGGKGDGDKFGLSTNLNSFDGDKKIAINLMANNINETNFAEQGRGGGRRGNNNTERGLSDTYAGAINFNNAYLDKKLDISADYKFESIATETNTFSNIEYLSDSRANQFREQNQYSDQRKTEHRANSRIRWEIDSTNRLDFSPNLSLTKTNRINDSYSRTTRNKEDLINESDRFMDNENSNFSVGANLTFMHRFLKNGRTISLNLSGNINTNNAEGLNLATTDYYKEALVSRIDTNNNKSTTNGYGSGFNNRISYTENISKRSRIQANYNFRNTANYSDRETFEFLAETGQLGELRDRLSNEFRNDFQYHSAGLSYSYNRKDSLRIQAGLNYQHGIRVNKRSVPINLQTEANFGSFLPEFTATYNFTKSRTLEFNYNTATNAPSINQLQDFVNNQNELRIANGNPNLEQEYNHRLRLQYRDVNRSSGRSLTTNFDFNYTNDKIIESRLITDSTIVLFEGGLGDEIILEAGGQYTVPENVDGAYAVRLRNSYGLPIKKLKLNLNLNTNLFYNNDYAILNDELLNSTTYGFNQEIGFNTNFSKRYIFRAGYHINATYNNNPVSERGRYHVYRHRVNGSATVELFKKWIVSSNIMYLYNSGILGSEGIVTNILNASLGYKLFKKQNGELAIRGFDLLNNAQNISRNINTTSISDVTSNTLNRYFLLMFTYNLRNFGGGKNSR